MAFMGVPSIISLNSTLEGSFVSNSSLDIDGEVFGNIKCSHLTIRARGTVRGDVIASTASVHGYVKGVVRAKHVKFGKTAKFDGEVFYSSIVVDSGASINGSLHMVAENDIIPAIQESDALPVEPEMSNNT